MNGVQRTKAIRRAKRQWSNKKRRDDVLGRTDAILENRKRNLANQADREQKKKQKEKTQWTRQNQAAQKPPDTGQNETQTKTDTLQLTL